MLPNERLDYLLKQYMAKTYSIAEKEELLLYINEAQYDEQIRTWLNASWNTLVGGADQGQDKAKDIFDSIIKADVQEKQTAAVRRIPMLRWWAAAAVILAISLAGAWLFNRSTESVPQVAAHVEKDIEPGKDGAILTLADGSTVVLDSLGNGVVATQGKVQVMFKDGKLAYASEGMMAAVAQEPMFYNTMSTPRGRQFQLLLSDGTKVWLNAASSIRFPAFFKGDKREVEVTGEVYFEVAHNPLKPFRVHYNNALPGEAAHNGVVEVLGTHFNINAYPDEPEIQTTLLEGSVKVSQGAATAMLKPGQQAAVKVEPGNKGQAKEDLEVRQANLDQVVAWKDGVFNFHHAGLKSALRQIARWYDVEVVYEKGVPDIEFAGKVQRNLSLMQIMKGLGDEEVHFRVEGRKLIVMP